jgi:hypothetical protein
MSSRGRLERLGPLLFGLLLLLCCLIPEAHAASFYVDCLQGSNGNSGAIDAPWRTPLKIGAYSASPGFSPGDAIYLHRGCVWNDGLVFTSSGSSGSNISIDAYGNGMPPRLTGWLAIPAADWSVSSGSVWVSKPLYSSSCASDGNCVQCNSAGVAYSCLDQADGQMNFVRFGTVWGNQQASSGSLNEDRDWYFDASAQQLYVYCTCSGGANPQSWYGQVVPIAVSNEQAPGAGGAPMLNLNGVEYVEVQHLLLNWFDSLGVLIQGASDHIWIANMAANSYVENAKIISGQQYTQIGFWAEPSTGATDCGGAACGQDIHLYNVDAMADYAGFKFGAGGGAPGQLYDLENCRAYGNRTYGLVDDTDGGVTHSHCHFYGNNLASGTETDFATDCVTGSGCSGAPYPVPACDASDVGGTACAGNGGQIPPWVAAWQRWPAYVTLTYDDPGLVQYSDEYINQVMGVITQKLAPSQFSIAVVTGSDYSQGIVARVQGWINAGWDVLTHSVSHEYWNPPSTTTCSDSAGPIPCEAFKLQYTGSIASAVTLTISHSGAGGTLTINSSPFDPCAYHVWDLTPVAPGATAASSQINTIGAVVATLEAGGCWTVDATALGNSVTKGDAHAYSLADVSAQDLVSASYAVKFDETYLETDEMRWARDWMNHYFTGLPATRLYVMPGMYGDSITEGIASSLGFAGVRGTGSLKPCCGASTTLGAGYDKFNLLSQGAVPNLQNLTYLQMRRLLWADLFKNALWGRPIGIFWHINELPPDQVENLIDGLEQGGATLLSNTALVNFLISSCHANDTTPPVGVGDTGSSYVARSFYTCPGTGLEADWRPTVNSPTNGWGADLGSPWNTDILGNPRGSSWDIGAYAYVPTSMGGMTRR